MFHDRAQPGGGYQDAGAGVTAHRGSHPCSASWQHAPARCRQHGKHSYTTSFPLHLHKLLSRGGLFAGDGLPGSSRRPCRGRTRSWRSALRAASPTSRVRSTSTLSSRTSSIDAAALDGRLRRTSVSPQAVPVRRIASGYRKCDHHCGLVTCGQMVSSLAASSRKPSDLKLRRLAHEAQPSHCASPIYVACCRHL